MAAEIAVVMPVYNRQELVKRTLQSIADQETLPGHLILVDNNSSDSTPDVLTDWAYANNGKRGMRVSVLKETTPGAAAARNAGLAHVTEPWVMHFDSDDAMLPSHISRVAAAIAAHPRAHIIGWDVKEVSLGGTAKILPFEPTDCIYHCVMHGMMASQRYAARTSLLSAAGGWDPDMRIWNDVELGLRMLLALPQSAEIAKVSGTPAVVVYCQQESITGTAFSLRAPEIENAIAAMEHTLPPHSRWMTRLRSSILAGHYRREGRQDLARALQHRTLAAEPSARRRLLLRLAHAYTSAGGRGAARLLRPLF